MSNTITSYTIQNAGINQTTIYPFTNSTTTACLVGYDNQTYHGVASSYPPINSAVQNSGTIPLGVYLNSSNTNSYSGTDYTYSAISVINIVSASTETPTIINIYISSQGGGGGGAPAKSQSIYGGPGGGGGGGYLCLIELVVFENCTISIGTKLWNDAKCGEGNTQSSNYGTASSLIIALGDVSTTPNANTFSDLGTNVTISIPDLSSTTIAYLGGGNGTTSNTPGNGGTQTVSDDTYLQNTSLSNIIINQNLINYNTLGGSSNNSSNALNGSDGYSLNFDPPLVYSTTNETITTMLIAPSGGQGQQADTNDNNGPENLGGNGGIGGGDGGNFSSQEWGYDGLYFACGGGGGAGNSGESTIVGGFPYPGFVLIMVPN